MVWEGSWNLRQPSFCLQSRGASLQLLSLRLLQVGASTPWLWPCSRHRGRQSPLGMGWEEKDGNEDS